MELVDILWLQDTVSAANQKSFVFDFEMASDRKVKNPVGCCFVDLSWTTEFPTWNVEAYSVQLPGAGMVVEAARRRPLVTLEEMAAEAGADAKGFAA